MCQTWRNDCISSSAFLFISPIFEHVLGRFCRITDCIKQWGAISMVIAPGGIFWSASWKRTGLQALFTCSVKLKYGNGNAFNPTKYMVISWAVKRQLIFQPLFRNRCGNPFGWANFWLRNDCSHFFQHFFFHLKNFRRMKSNSGSINHFCENSFFFQLFTKCSDLFEIKIRIWNAKLKRNLFGITRNCDRILSIMACRNNSVETAFLRFFPAQTNSGHCTVHARFALQYGISSMKC